ncbi:MAG: hypothetical protein HKL87_00300 [Acidimicrobiaceae bacterium]|nr:hypothetical protein [Acidimicrobiaceae bacterium]
MSALRRVLVGLVGVLIGGMAGTLVRDLGQQIGYHADAVSPWGRVMWALIVINTLGVWVAVHLLAGRLRHHDPDDPWRLLLITGLLGGFTSYSSLVANIHAVWGASVGAALTEILVSGLLGIGAGWWAMRSYR